MTAEQAEAKDRLATAEDGLHAAEARSANSPPPLPSAGQSAPTLEASLTERQERVVKIERQLVELDAQAREIAGRAPDAEKLAQITDAGKRLAEEIARLRGAGRRGGRHRAQRWRAAADQAREESAARAPLLDVTAH